MRLRIFSRWKFKMPPAICGSPATFGAMSQIIRKLRMRLKIGHFCPISTHFEYLQANIEPLGIRKIDENSRIPRISEFPEIFRLMRKSAHSWVAEIRLEIGYFYLYSQAFFDLWPYNLQPLEIRSIARNLRATGNFRAPVADPRKTQNTTENWPFLPNLDAFLSTSRQIFSRWGFKSTGGSRISRIS